MWSKVEFARVGTSNREKGLECQDYIHYEENGSVQVITLADGNGENDYARMGAGKSCRVLAELLAENYEQLYNMDKPRIQFNVAANLKTELYLLCDLYGIRIEQLQSTLLGLAIDHKSGTYLTVHLGDGRIGVEKDGVHRTLSFPENGRNRRQTFLTSMRKMGSHIRIQKGNIDDIREFALMSDGWQYTDYEKISSDLSRQREKQISPVSCIHYADDVSYISLCCNEYSKRV